eukprot:2569757-Rhodomonas_salina.1
MLLEAPMRCPAVSGVDVGSGRGRGERCPMPSEALPPCAVLTRGAVGSGQGGAGEGPRAVDVQPGAGEGDRRAARGSVAVFALREAAPDLERAGDGRHLRRPVHRGHHLRGRVLSRL